MLIRQIIICCFVSCSVFFYAQSSSAAASDSEKKIVLRRLHNLLEETRKNVLANCSYRATRVEQSSGSYEGKALSEEDQRPYYIHYQYWAREGGFIRVDVYRHQEKPKQVSERWVVRPEGFAHFSSGGANGDLIMTDWNLGNSSKAMGFIRGMFIHHPSTNFGGSNIELWFGRFIGLPGWSERAPVSTIGKVAQADGMLMFESSQSGNDVVSTKTFYLDLARGGVIDRITIKSHKDGKLIGFDEPTFDYDLDKSPVIPSRIVTEYRGDPGLFTRTTLEFFDIDLTPPPLEIFAVEGIGLAGYSSSGIWIRRAILLVVGLSLLAVYIMSRRKAR